MTKIDIGAGGLLLEPDLARFTQRYSAGASQVVWTRLVADLETPVSAMLKLSDGEPMSCLLESVQGGTVRGRYSIIGLRPDTVWRAFGNKAEINREALRAPDAFAPDELRRCRRCVPSWRNRASSCPRSCRRLQRASSVTWATTRCG